MSLHITRGKAELTIFCCANFLLTVASGKPQLLFSKDLHAKAFACVDLNQQLFHNLVVFEA